LLGGAAVPAARPDPEVREKKAYRRVTAEYKLRILREADACAPGELGALLRREGLYSSHLTRWRAQRERGVLNALVSRKRGRKEDIERPLRKKLVAQEREIERLQKRLRQAETIIDVQKKVSEMLGISLESSESGGRDE
jgi:transposase InsO family protein